MTVTPREACHELLYGLLHTLRTAVRAAPAPVERRVAFRCGNVDARYSISMRVGLAADRPRPQPPDGGTQG